MSGYKYSVQTITSKNPVKIYKQLIICPVKDYIKWDSFQVVNSFDKILQLIERSHINALDLSNLEADEIDKILDITTLSLEHLTLNNCKFNNESIEKCANLIIFEGNCLYNLVSLWNVNKNASLENLTLNICTNLKDIDGIKNSNISTFEIYNSSRPSKIKNYKVLQTLTRLENLTLLLDDIEDKTKLLELLSTLTTLKNLSLPKNFFTFNQFAWLKSKLPNEKNISALYHIKKDIANERVYASIIGNDKPSMVYEDEESLESYQDEFVRLVELYKNARKW